LTPGGGARPHRRRSPTTTQPWPAIARLRSRRFSRSKTISRRFASSIKKRSNRKTQPPRILDQEAQQQKDATASAQESLQVFTDRYIGGADPYLQVLTAQTIALQNERNDVDIRRRRMDASVLLIKALGGGWNASQLPKVAQLR